MPPGLFYVYLTHHCISRFHTQRSLNWRPLWFRNFRWTFWFPQKEPKWCYRTYFLVVLICRKCLFLSIKPEYNAYTYYALLWIDRDVCVFTTIQRRLFYFLVVKILQFTTTTTTIIIITASKSSSSRSCTNSLAYTFLIEYPNDKNPLWQ